MHPKLPQASSTAYDLHHQTAVMSNFAYNGQPYRNINPTFEEDNEERISRSRFKMQYRWMGASSIISGCIVLLLEICFVATVIQYDYGFYCGIWTGISYITTGVLAMQIAANAGRSLIIALIVFCVLSLICGGLSVALNGMEISFWFRAWNKHDLVMGKGVTSIGLAFGMILLSILLIIISFKDACGDKPPPLVRNKHSNKISVPQNVIPNVPVQNIQHIPVYDEVQTTVEKAYPNTVSSIVSPSSQAFDARSRASTQKQTSYSQF